MRKGGIECSGSDGKESACNAGDSGLIPGSGRSLEEEMASHSSILAWKIPWAEKPGQLQFMRLQRVRHDLAIEHQQHNFTGIWYLVFSTLSNLSVP